MTTTSTKNQRRVSVTFRLPRAVKDKLAALSQMTGIPQTELVIRALGKLSDKPELRLFDSTRSR